MLKRIYSFTIPNIPCEEYYEESNPICHVFNITFRFILDSLLDVLRRGRGAVGREDL